LGLVFISQLPVISVACCLWLVGVARRFYLIDKKMPKTPDPTIKILFFIFLKN